MKKKLQFVPLAVRLNTFYIIKIMFVQTELNKSNNNNEVNEMCVYHETLLPDLDVIGRFCMPICNRDNEVREVALDVITKTVEGWLDGVGSPKHSCINNRHTRKSNHHQTQSSKNSSCSDYVGNNVGDIPSEYLDLVALHLPIILRLSIGCPFVNVREKCQHILDIVQVSNESFFFYFS